jgi:hypothetical protein
MPVQKPIVSGRHPELHSLPATICATSCDYANAPTKRRNARPLKIPSEAFPASRKQDSNQDRHAASRKWANSVIACWRLVRIRAFLTPQPLRKLSEQPCHFPSATIKDENRGSSAGTPHRKSGLSGRITAGVKRRASRRRVFSEQLLFEKKLLIPALRQLVSSHPRQHDR